MNAKRRSQLKSIAAMISDARNRLDELCEDERAAQDAIPESFRETERFEQLEEHLCVLEESVTMLDEVEYGLDELL